MTSDPRRPTDPLAADEAFALLGNETRMGIVRVLGSADEPIPFSALREAVGVADSGQFNYHLDKLTDHFVRQVPEGYVLRRSGRRIFEAVLSGAVSRDPHLPPTPVDVGCPVCETPLAVSYGDNRVKLLCPGCDGIAGQISRPLPPQAHAYALGHPELAETDSYGYLGGLFLPPAGVAGRSHGALFVAGLTWGNHQHLTAASGHCPSCATDLELRPDVCETHDSTGGLCLDCRNRLSVFVTYRCPNCRYYNRSMLSVHLQGTAELLSFLLDHDINPLSPDPERLIAVGLDYEEEVRSVDPFEGRFTFTAGGEAIALTVDEDLEVVAAERRPASG